MGNTFCMARFLKQVGFFWKFPSGLLFSCSPLTVKGSSGFLGCTGTLAQTGEAFQPGIPCRRAGTRHGGTEQLCWTVQRAQRPFPGLFQAWLLCSADVQPSREGLGACCMLGTAVVSSLCITHIRNPSCQPAASRCLLTAERRAKPPRHCSCSQLSGQALFDWRKGKFLVLGIREQRPELPLHCPS